VHYFVDGVEEKKKGTTDDKGENQKKNVCVCVMQ
jgi:hypothetical protein